MGSLLRHAPGHPVYFTNPTTRGRVAASIVDEVWAIEPDAPAFQQVSTGYR